MDVQGVSSHNLAPELPPTLTPEQSVALWLDLMDACDEFLLAGLRRQIGPNGNLREAYRRAYAQQMEEHDRMMIHMVEELNRRESGHGR